MEVEINYSKCLKTSMWKFKREKIFWFFLLRKSHSRVPYKGDRNFILKSDQFLAAGVRGIVKWLHSFFFFSFSFSVFFFFCFVLFPIVNFVIGDGYIFYGMSSQITLSVYLRLVSVTTSRLRVWKHTIVNSEGQLIELQKVLNYFCSRSVICSVCSVD